MSKITTSYSQFRKQRSLTKSTLSQSLINLENELQGLTSSTNRQNNPKDKRKRSSSQSGYLTLRERTTSFDQEMRQKLNKQFNTQKKTQQHVQNSSLVNNLPHGKPQTKLNNYSLLCQTFETIYESSAHTEEEPILDKHSKVFKNKEAKNEVNSKIKGVKNQFTKHQISKDRNSTLKELDSMQNTLRTTNLKNSKNKTVVLSKNKNHIGNNEKGLTKAVSQHVISIGKSQRPSNFGSTGSSKGIIKPNPSFKKKSSINTVSTAQNQEEQKDPNPKQSTKDKNQRNLVPTQMISDKEKQDLIGQINKMKTKIQKSQIQSEKAQLIRQKMVQLNRLLS